MPADEVAGSVDLARPRRVHLVGIGGSGMSAIATVLAEMGHTVSGSDLAGGAVVDRLRSAGIAVEVGHAAHHVGDAEVVAASTAVDGANPELVAARELGLRVLRRAEILSAICAVRRTVAVAGTHGKTTTSSMLALILRAGGLDPSFIIGGEVAGLDGGAHWGSGEWFVVEADESDGTFLELPRRAAVVTNVEPDHLDHYGGEAGLVAAFGRFVAETPGPVVVGLDDLGARAIADSAPRDVITYGEDEYATVRMSPPESDRHGVAWTVTPKGAAPVRLGVPAPGAHHAQNATAAAAMALELGVAPEVVAGALASYGGVARRFQRRGEVNGVTFVDDYAHLPTETRAAIAAARAGGYRRVVVVFQPHRYSRTEALWASFADAFEGADLVVLTDVYAAGEPSRPGIDGHLLVTSVLSAHPGQRVVYLPRREDLLAHVPGLLRPGDICLSLGAGDLTRLPDAWMGALAGTGGSRG